MKKYFYVALAAAMTAFSASTFTSCKDTDDITNERLTHAKDVKNLQDLIKGLQGQIDQLKGIDYATKEDLKKAIAESEDRTAERRNALIDSIKNVLRNYVTGISINEVKNNAFGSYNGFFTNLQTTCMIGYYGEDGDANPIPETIDLGQINFSINPAGADYTGQKMYLINSLGEQSVITLSPADEAKEVLMSGITRADEADTIYSYVTKASIAYGGDEDNIAAIKLDLNKSNLKAQLEKLNNANGAKPALQSIASIVNQVINALSVPRLGVKTIFEYEWYDDVVKNAQVTGFDVTAVAVKPLGFYAYEFKGVPGYSIVRKATEKVMDAVIKKVQTTLYEKYQGSELKEKLAEFKASLEDVKELKIVTTIDGTTVLQVVNYRDVVIGYITMDFVDKIFEDINAGLGNYNKVFSSASEMVDAINKFIEQIKNSSAASSFEESLLAKLDKYNEKIGVKLNHLFEPVLLVASNDGNLRRGGINNIPAVVEGPATLYPTTYSAEILTPIYQKTVTVDGVPAEIVNGKVILDEPGEYVIEYHAEDYCGKTFDETYYVTVK